MKDDKKFIEKWGKVRRNGKTYYMRTKIAFFMMIWSITLIFTVIKIDNLMIVLPVFSGLLAGYIFGLPTTWNKNEKKYNTLLENE
ncbi:MAG: hypothetical protein E6344_11945 [Clostridium sp.]|uniref:hypothetical protein n=1 Tax=Clostridium culturomicium TaxID=1499683 RepID=UPI00058BED93|nr:hypothetical protein [Clostridium culturomicium]MDU4892283.1 hypothetical protein [Clostridium sp.]MDU7084400.1 hypothetical protein [Clostridium sp.]